MAIYLDSNALYGWNSFGELQRLALSLVADQLDQQIALPGLVVDEAARNYRESLFAVIKEHTQSIQKLNRYFGVTFNDFLEPAPDVDGAEKTWRRRLGEWTTRIETTGDDALGGLHRELHRLPPAKEHASGS